MLDRYVGINIFENLRFEFYHAAIYTNVFLFQRAEYQCFKTAYKSIKQFVILVT